MNENISDEKLLAITREFKQFETIFLWPPDSEGRYPARIFTVDEELFFAGHPIIGAAAVVHQVYFQQDSSVDIIFTLNQRLLPARSVNQGGHYQVTMDQGVAHFINRVSPAFIEEVAKAINLAPDDVDWRYPVEVVSTGLPYLLLPIKSNLSECRLIHDNPEAFLQAFLAKFIYVFDTKTLACRTWDNVARTEDIATGSAAGPLCAYLVEHGIRNINEKIEIHQGHFIGWPSVLYGEVAPAENQAFKVYLTGEVTIFAAGKITTL